MKIGLAVYEFKNQDIAFNISQIERAIKSAQGRVDLLCFGEAVLQGFSALCWDYDVDKDIAVSTDSETMHALCKLTLKYNVDILFGYIERCEDSLYSSCAVIASGKLIHNYRRISRGWKYYWLTDEHYKEGTETSEFIYHGQPFQIALCGDLWDYPERFQTQNPLIWPIYVDFDLDAWVENEPEYAQQAALSAKKTFMINSISKECRDWPYKEVEYAKKLYEAEGKEFPQDELCKDPPNYGGAFYFADGKLEQKTEYDKEDILIVEI